MSHKPYSISQDLWMVPCLVHRSTNDYEPLYKPFRNEINAEKLQIRQTWLSFEDDALKVIVIENGARNWISIAKDLNEKVHKGLPIRQGKQCRERWYNHLCPTLHKGKWSTTEDLTILKKQKEIGNRWSEIASLLEGRTENQVKNRFKSLMRKAKNLRNNDKDPIELLIQQLREGAKEKSENFVVPSVINAMMPFFPYPGMNSTGFNSLGEGMHQNFSNSQKDEPSSSLFYHT
ncbi:hypothetical protein SteCoe_9916 [Stentor coeruleus]|uniref:Myb-like DNA-binding domain containing protein n=1 Tax=Stentor coeruleus TaxID=5963 RepID=A0A1R2CGQ5_9CILI|nr:hypothetical protein SteCoe_9916 [Stentor coeruleus]